MGLLDRLRGGTSEGSSERWLVVGLGNPPGEYGGTRHNIGQDVVRALGLRLGASFSGHKAPAQAADTFDRPGGTPLTLALPHGYMNRTGGPVQALLRFYRLGPERLIVVHDDLDLDLGVLRLKCGGGTAGHNGLRDIAQRIGSPDFYRVRVGIGRPPGRQPAKDYVLRRFATTERDDVEAVVARAGDAVLDLVTQGLEPAQNRHHAG